MGYKGRIRVRHRQLKRRKKRRKKLQAKGQNPNESFYGKTYVGPRKGE